jgi:hypothetical protein
MLAQTNMDPETGAFPGYAELHPTSSGGTNIYQRRKRRKSMSWPLFELPAVRRCTAGGHPIEAVQAASIPVGHAPQDPARSLPGKPRSKALRRVVAVMVGAVVLLLAFAATAEAYTVNGGSREQQRMVREVLEYNRDLLAIVESVFPDFAVNINYGGRAEKGYIDVNIRQYGRTFYDEVVHEFGHEVQLAADAHGGLPEIDCAWDRELINRGYPESMWVWSRVNPNYGELNPFECFTENLSMLWPSKYHYAPDTRLARLSAAEMRDFLTRTGVL